MSDQKDILVYIEADELNGILPVSLETVQIGAKLSLKKGGKLIAFLAGKDMDHVKEALQYFGFDTIYCADHPELESYDPECYLPVLSEICGQLNLFAVLFANTLTSIDLAARLSVRPFTM